MRWRYLFFVFSSLFIIPGLISLALWGFKLSIDFTGGSLWEVRLLSDQVVESQAVLAAVQDVYPVDTVQSSGENQFIIRGKEVSNEQKDLALEKLKTAVSVQNSTDLRFDTVGPVLGQELLRKMFAAVVIAAVFIAFYVWRQFDELKYGIAAILAMLHDSLVILGIFSLLGHFLGVEVGVLFVTAVLTTLSFSVHDTIVVFDRIRELRRNHRTIPYVRMVNTAVLETLTRSVNNSLTIIFMLLALVLMGGESLRWFAVALLVGAITGTYSSPFIAVPLLLVWDDIKGKLRERKQA